MTDRLEPGDIAVGVVGLGLMGSSITMALLIAGHPVKAIAPLPEDAECGPLRIKTLLTECNKSGLLNGSIESYLLELTITGDYSQLEGCRFVLECVTESFEVKKMVYQQIASATGNDCVIATNTSAIPISLLQQYVSFPGRFMGVH